METKVEAQIVEGKIGVRCGSCGKQTVNNPCGHCGTNMELTPAARRALGLETGEERE
ncbi:MAG: hypothetical protein GWN53_17125 [Gammaproteobacteria bacterium]|nr:hypothetical protein [Gammaproteobacteria bacterium]